MSVQDHFNRISNEYDAKRRFFIPSFDDFYINTTKFIASSIHKPRVIMDLGAGTGLLTYYWYKYFPDAQYILVDIAEEMLKVASARFSYVNNISYIIEDYSSQLPEINFDAAISALSIHHLDNNEKEKLFHNIYCRLPNHGIFVNYDQFCGKTEIINSWYNKYWGNYLHGNGLTDNDLNLWKERQKLDRECSVSQEIEMLTASGFTASECIFSCQKFSVIVAIK